MVTLFDVAGRSICGPFPSAARASDALAKAHGNARRNPLFLYGDTPTGGYRILRLHRSGGDTPFPAERFGPNGVIVLEPVSGEAALAEANGRFHFLIAGGPRAGTGELVSTAGSLRLADEHQRALSVALRKSANVRCEIRQRADLAVQGGVFIDPECQDADPIGLFVADRDDTPDVARAIARDAPRLSAGAAGAMIFGVSVSFVAMASTPAHATPLIAAHRADQARDVAQAPAVAAAPAPSLVRLAYNTVGPAPSHQSAAPMFGDEPNDTGEEYIPDTARSPAGAANAVPPITPHPETIDPMRTWKEPLPADQLSVRDQAIDRTRAVVMEDQQIPPGDFKINSLFRTHSAAHMRGAFDVNIQGSTDPSKEASDIETRLGPGFITIYENPNKTAGTQTNVEYFSDGTSKTVTGTSGGSQFHATGPHIHVQPSQSIFDKEKPPK